MKKIIFTVTNDLCYDQRMHRICGSLAAAGYQVVLVGFQKKNSVPLSPKNYKQIRLPCFFKKGKLFYLEYNLRLFIYLLFQRADCICAIDMDTIVPCYGVSRLKGIRRVYDAHEYFSQLNEVISRPLIYRFWHYLEKMMIPRFPKGYTVCQSLAKAFNEKFGVSYEVIRNVPILEPLPLREKVENTLLYQGAVNKGRGLDNVVAALQQTKVVLWVCGEGNFMRQMKEAVTRHEVSDKVIFWGMLNPDDLKQKTAAAWIAINPFEKTGLNQFLSLSNKFFDYLHARLPQITMNYPEYRHYNQQYEVALLIDDLNPDTIAKAINRLISDVSLYNKLVANCTKAREEWNWQREEKNLLLFYQKLFHE